MVFPERQSLLLPQIEKNHRNRESADIGYEEHPRAGTSDDVEAIIALFHRYLGNIFTAKEFKACWRKVVR